MSAVAGESGKFQVTTSISQLRYDSALFRLCPDRSKKHSSMSFEYTYQKFYEAVSALVSSDRGLGDRLKSALISLVAISDADLPDEAITKWQGLKRCTTDVTMAEGDNRGTNKASIETMSPDELKHHAETVYDIFRIVAKHLAAEKSGADVDELFDLF